MTTSTKESSTSEDIFKIGNLIESDGGDVFIVNENLECEINITCVYHSRKEYIGTYFSLTESYAKRNYKQFHGTITLKSGNNKSIVATGYMLVAEAFEAAIQEDWSDVAVWHTIREIGPTRWHCTPENNKEEVFANMYESVVKRLINGEKFYRKEYDK